MADPLSIIALILDITSRVVSYIHDVKDGSEVRRKLILEITSTTGIFHTLKSLEESADAEQGWSKAFDTLGQSNCPLVQYQRLPAALQRRASELLEGRRGLLKAGHLYW